MSDTFNLDVVLRVMTQGLQSGAVDVKTFEEALKRIQATGGASEKAIQQAGNAAVSAGTKSVKSANDQAKAQARLEAATKRRVAAEAGLKRDRDNRAATSWDAEAQALGGLTTQADAAAKNLPRLRYALFDVSTAMAATGAAALALGVATLGVNTSMDRAFADVLRTSEIFDTTGSAANALRGEFEDLFTSMPVSWGALTEIGTLAGQLNIASDSVGEFTELVAMFAATTDVSIEASATAFGRLSQLLDVPSDELQNLGSSILAVGVNSVATESQIIAISTQITSMAASVGFSADQVFGLSAALASLGTQPELSRGVITRLFTNINAAITEGGERLDAFGRLAGQTGQEFAKSWGDDAAAALYELMDGLGRVEGSQAGAALAELGITASRDIPTLLRLAQNSEVLADSLNVAAQGYQDGTALSDQYGVIAGTVAEKLTVLGNNFQLLISNLGEMDGVLGWVVDGLNGFLGILNWLTENPITSFLLSATVAITAMGGALLVVGALALRGFASLIALKTVTMELAASGFTASASLGGMTASLFGVAGGATAAASALRAVRFAALGLGVISVLAVGVSLLWDAFSGGGQEAARTLGDVSGYVEAVKKDTQEWIDTSKAIATIDLDTRATRFDKAVGEVSSAVDIWLGTQKEAPKVLGDTDRGIGLQTIALGENAEAWLRNALAQDEWIAKLAQTGNQAALSAVGFNIDDFMTATLQGGTALDEYLAGIKAKIDEVLSDNPDMGTVNAFSSLKTILDEVGNSANATNSELLNALQVNQFLGGSALDTGESLEEFNERLRESYDAAMDSVSGQIAVENALFNLGESLIENGNAWDYFSEAGRANMGALASVMDQIASNNAPDVAAAKMQGLFNFIVQGGYASAQQLAVLQQAINALANGAVVSPIAFNPQSFFGGVSSGYQKVEKAARSAGNAAREAKEEVRSLVDYSRDLSSVFGRAFEIRNDSTSTLDAIADKFQDLRDASEESARSIRSLRADLLGLNSDLKIQEYFLSVAIEYGDTTRADAIRADIAKLQSDIADKTSELSKEQSKNSKELTGNTEAARRNRGEMEDLVKQYQDHILALAESGMSQDELARKTAALKQDFLAQATQMGYNRAELGRYAKSFDDMTLAIQRVPRNITVSANTNPALQALNEFIAKANAASASPRVTPSGGGYGDGWNQGKAYGQGWVAGTNASRRLVAVNSPGTPGGKAYAYYNEYGHKVSPDFFADGGYTGSGGKYEPAGIVHRGEYVIPKKDVNQATGLPYADALGRLTRGQPGRTGYSGGGHVSPPMGRETVDLSAMSIQQLAQVMDKFIVVNGKVIAQTATSANEFQNNIGAY